MNDFVEVGIVGAGPAGARAAELLAAQGAGVLLLDAKAPWEKPCGGGLTSTIFDEIPEMLEVQSFSRRIDRARVELGTELQLDVRLARPIWIVSREALGDWQLQRAVAAGAVHERLRVRGVTRAASRGWLLETDRGPIGVGTLIGADGAASLVRRAAGSRLSLDPILARVEYPREGSGDALVLRFFPDFLGYLWDFPRTDHRSVGVEVARGGVARADLDAALDEYGTSETEKRVGAVIGSRQPLRLRFAHLAGERYALLGDAAGLADPFTGEGIRNALRSAGLLAEARMMSPASDWPRAYARLARRAFRSDLARAAVARKLLSETGLGIRLVRRAASSGAAYAAVAALLDSLAEHDYALGHLLGRWLDRWRDGRTTQGPCLVPAAR
jgi:flavin-dependent dehydrogenase